VTAQVGRIAGNHDHVACADGDYLLAAWADVGLARLGGVDPPDVEAERFAGRGQVGDLLELFQLERRTLGLLAPPTTSWGRAGHARQVSHSRPLLGGPPLPPHRNGPWRLLTCLCSWPADGLSAGAVPDFPGGAQCWPRFLQPLS
jgi:hypothetical protein